MTAGFQYVPSGQVGVVGRSGRYRRTLEPGLSFLLPLLERATLVDLREQVIPLPGMPVITSDGLVVTIDALVYLEVTDPKAVVFDRPGYLAELGRLTTVTLRDVVGAMDMEQALTSRAEINSAVRRTIEWSTGDWGVRVNRLEIRDMVAPAGFLEAWEKRQQPEGP